MNPLELALESKVADLWKARRDCQRQIDKLRQIAANRRPGDKYVSQEHLLRVIENWESTRDGWTEQLNALIAHIESLREEGKL